MLELEVVSACFVTVFSVFREIGMLLGSDLVFREHVASSGKEPGIHVKGPPEHTNCKPDIAADLIEEMLLMRAGKFRNTLTAVAALLLALPIVSHGATYKVVEVADGGSVKGKLSFEGALPADAIEKIGITKNPEVCDKDPNNPGYREVIWIDVDKGALRGAFVYLDKVKKGKKWAPPTDGKDGDFLVNQEGCRFRPWAQVVKPGNLVIRNSDKGVLHNINTRELIGVEKKRKPIKRTMFNFGQPDPGDIEQELKPRRSAHISVNCEAHNFMFAYMMAPKHPYAVVVKEDGSYSIDNIPPGKYTLKAWHPRLGVKKAKITVPAKGSVENNFVFSAKK